ncbi:unnamed protein product, partial [Prorocentrum cordatum]
DADANAAPCAAVFGSFLFLKVILLRAELAPYRVESTATRRCATKCNTCDALETEAMSRLIGGRLTLDAEDTTCPAAPTSESARKPPRAHWRPSPAIRTTRCQASAPPPSADREVAAARPGPSRGPAPIAALIDQLQRGGAAMSRDGWGPNGSSAVNDSVNDLQSLQQRGKTSQFPSTGSVLKL